MVGLKGITIAVGDAYADCLGITLVRNMRHLARCLVVTTPDDRRVQSIAASVPGVNVLTTNAFYEHGAKFNKGYAMELGFDAHGRDGWQLIWDADILLPDTIPTDRIRPDCIHGARRRILREGPAAWRPDLDWDKFPLNPDRAPIGYFQLFHGHCLKDKRPWYDVSFAHAGGGDAYFLQHWPRSKQVMLNAKVLHIGDNDCNWFGTTPEARDLMAAFVARNGWRRALAKHDPTAVDRVGEIVERVDVPGYEPTGYELPFVERAKARQARP